MLINISLRGACELSIPARHSSGGPRPSDAGGSGPLQLTAEVPGCSKTLSLLCVYISAGLHLY